MELWIPITLFAALSQNVRSALQKHLTGRLSTIGATQIRFFYAVPFALLYLGFLTNALDYELPSLNSRFLTLALFGALGQVVASALLVALFSYRNFFVGTAFSKTETIQSALVGLILLGDRLTLGALAGIFIGLAGVIAISAAETNAGIARLGRSLLSGSTIIGILIGLFFGIAAVCFRGASLALDGGYAIQAGVTLTFALMVQSVVLAIYLAVREPGQMTAIVRNWRIASLVGLSGMAASTGWFTAMTIQNVAYVKAVGQIELVFSFLASALFFRERTTRSEMLGAGLIVASIIVLLLFR